MNDPRIFFSIFCLGLLWLAGCGLTQEQIASREEHLSQAEDYYRNQKYRNAWQQIEKALEIDPQCKRALISKGWTLFYLNMYDEADQAFQQAYQLDNTDPWLHYGMGTIAFKRGGKIEQQMAQMIASAYLFSMDTGYENDLNIGRIPADMRRCFEDNKHSLSDKAQVDLEKKDAEWRIEDLTQGKEYLVVRGSDPVAANIRDALNVYEPGRLKASMERAEKEREMWYEKSLDHLTKSQAVNPENRDLYKMIGMVYVARGIPHYPKALENLNYYIQFLDEEAALLEAEREVTDKKRLEPGLLEKQKEELDSVLGKLELDVEKNRKEYRIVQALAGELLYQMAYQEKQEAEKSKFEEVKQKHLTRMHEYAHEARVRLDLILKTAPYLSNQYLNHAAIAKLEGNNELALKYLQEYVRHCPVGDPKVMVRVKEDIEFLERELKQ